MCELFCISSRQPTTAPDSLSTFASRGGNTGHHVDGWGIAFFRDGDALLVRGAEPSARSAHLEFLSQGHEPSPLIISHIRRATQGRVCLRNTQPFTRELGGRPHIFAHNGDLGLIHQHPEFAGKHYRPIGDTDSEFAFCYLLKLLQPLWQDSIAPTFEQRLEVFRHFARDAAVFGEANFLYSDGDYLFVHAHRRRQNDGTVCPPGLHMLHRRHHEGNHDADSAADFNTTPEQSALLLASVPLSDEPWQPLPEFTVLAIAQGRICARLDSHGHKTPLDSSECALIS